MEVMHNRVNRSITINQQQYIHKILERFELKNARSVSTPMAANAKFEKLDAPEVEQPLYQSMLGSLMYAAIGTHPDIMYAIHCLSQFSITPGPAHLMALKHIYCYLNGTRGLGIIFDGNQLQDGLIAYSDSDWAGDPNSRKSVLGYVMIFCGAVIAWSAKKQSTLALSSTEAEYMAMTHAGKEVTFLKHTFGDVGIPTPFPVHLPDRQSICDSFSGKSDLPCKIQAY